MKGYLKRYWACPWFPCLFLLINFLPSQIFIIRFNFKQLLDEVFVISGIIKVEVSVISRSRRLRLITLTETLIIPEKKPNLIIVSLYIVLKKITTNALSQRSQFIFKHLQMYNWVINKFSQSSALGNHALSAQPTDYSLICRYRLVNNL